MSGSIDNVVQFATNKTVCEKTDIVLTYLFTFSHALWKVYAISSKQSKESWELDNLYGGGNGLPKSIELEFFWVLLSKP